MARGWPPPFLRLRRHRAVLHERGDFPRPDRCPDRDARRPRPDPRAGADSDGRAHRLDGKARPDAEFRTLSGLRPWAEDGALRLLRARSEEHTSELQSLMRTPYAVFCLKKNKRQTMKNLMIAYNIT